MSREMMPDEILESLSSIVRELTYRESEYKLLLPELKEESWNGLCEKGAELFNQLKDNRQIGGK